MEKFLCGIAPILLVVSLICVIAGFLSLPHMRDAVMWWLGAIAVFQTMRIWFIKGMYDLKLKNDDMPRWHLP